MNFKKVMLIVTCAVLLIAGTIAVTLAYLIDEDSVTNTFTVGKVDIKVEETEEDGSKTEEGLEYHLLPGEEYAKDPTLTVIKGSEEAYVRMVMVIHNQPAVQTIVDKYCGGDYAKLLYFDDNNNFSPDWEYVGFEEDTTNNTISFEFRYKEAVDASEAAADVALPALFTKLVVPELVSGTELAALYGADGETDDFKIVVYGHAIQATGFATPEDAWAGFEAQLASNATP